MNIVALSYILLSYSIFTFVVVGVRDVALEWFKCPSRWSFGGNVAVSRCFKFISIELSFEPLHFIYYLHLRQLHVIFCFVEI